ncbi:unnamed protein product [Penicillium pancosmium]
MTGWRLFTGLSVERREHASGCAVTVTVTVMVMVTSCIQRQTQSHAPRPSSAIIIHYPTAPIAIAIAPRHHPVQPSKGDDFCYRNSESPGPVKAVIPAVCNSVMPHGGSGALWAGNRDTQTLEKGEREVTHPDTKGWALLIGPAPL